MSAAARRQVSGIQLLNGHTPIRAIFYMEHANGAEVGAHRMCPIGKVAVHVTIGSGTGTMPASVINGEPG